MYHDMRSAPRQFGGVSLNDGVPVILVCQHCGHVLEFILDATLRRDALLRWRP